MKSDNKLVISSAIGVDMIAIFRNLWKNLANLAMVSALIGMWIYMGITFFMPISYEAKASVVIVAEENIATYLKEYNYSTAITQYYGIFISDVYINEVETNIDSFELDSNHLIAEVGLDSNLFVFTGKANTAEEAFLIVKAALESFDAVSHYAMDGYTIEIVGSPSVDNIAVVDNNVISLSIGIALLIFLILNGVLVLLHVLSGKIDNEQQAKRKINTEYLGSVAYEPKENVGKNNATKSSILISDPSVSFRYTQDILKLASRIRYQAAKNNDKVFVIGSVLENEGKSSVAVNLSLAMAKRGKKVLLLDMDIRKPAVSLILDLEVDPEKEIGKMLMEDKAYEDIISYDPVHKVYYVAGTKGYSDSKPFNDMRKYAKFLERAKEEMDYIIMDTAPVGLVRDIELYGVYADAMYLVVRQDVASSRMIQDSIDALRWNDVQVNGFMLNGVIDTVRTPKKRK